ncbi:MAG TPA: MarR family transcriptional regulator [Candidatus Stackebrandtia excrementipullorum]|nr:MarR family transcriptional regulator [Candidatus Stackebrandtia excrementipullorum]
MTAPRWLNEQENHTWRAFHHVRSDLGATLERQLVQDSGLSSADYELLVVLSETDGHRLRARELRTQVSWDRSRLAHQLRRMEKRGLLRRTECEADARGTMVELTEHGLESIRAAAPGHLAAARRYFVDLMTPDEMKVMADICDRVLERIRDDRQTGQC